MLRSQELDGVIPTRPTRFAPAGWLPLVGVCVSFAGCSGGTSVQWLKNGLLDPTQVGNFEKSISNEIRGSISILEEPEGIQNAEEPSAEDIEPRFAEKRIGPGDFLSVSIFELLVPGAATSVQIRAGNSGFETFPVIGQVRVGGLTARELELELKERIREAEVLDDADVQVSITQSPADQFSVVGFVSRPNIYQLPRPDYRLLEGLAAAGGVPQFAEKIYIFRNERRGRTTPVSPNGVTIPRSETESAEQTPAPFTMSDTSRGRVSSMGGTLQEEPPSPTTAHESINELDILEGGPTSGPQIMPRWDAELGEWILEQAVQPPAAIPATQVEVPIAEPGPSPAPATSEAEEVEREGQVFEEAVRQLEVPLRIIEIPAKELLDGDPRYNIFIRPGDTISVPEGFVGEFYLGGNIARAGAYSLTGRRITVKQAIVAAGGFGPLALPARAEVVRRVGKDEEQVIQLDLDAIFAGKAPDFYVKPNDIVNVGTTPVAPFMAVLRNAFRFSYGMGFVYDRNFADSDTFLAKEQVKNRHLQEAFQRGLPTY